MILGSISDWQRYVAVHPRMEQCFQFLLRDDLSDLDDGRWEIEGDSAFAIVDRPLGRGKEDSPLECHRRYLDIQYVVDGVDQIGWMPTAHCRFEKAPFNAERDLGFFSDRPATWCHLPSGHFAVFFPEDAHAPLGGSGPVHKVVVKIEL